MKIKLSLIVALMFSLSYSCINNSEPLENTTETLKWAENSTIYEVNIRQYTPEGTFNAFAEHLPRLKEMGVELLWLMPIHPISEKNRKGSLGSYYSVKDYLGINPEFGTEADFRALIDKIHELDMKIIIDWVANHTGWDNPLIEEHPEWYKKDENNNIISPVADWTDVAGLNFEQPELRKYMTDALIYWVKEFNIDGYRCDVAGMVPLDFWENARKELDKIKPVFMLAEHEDPKFQESAFDMTYGWEFHHLMNKAAKNEIGVNEFNAYFDKIEASYQKDDIVMYFTSNHDENSWNGTVFERLGEKAQFFAVMTYMIPGMPLIYSGQEAKLTKRLLFFEKDQIDWNTYEWGNFYKSLTEFKLNNQAVWNGLAGGDFKRINLHESVFAFSRTKENNTVISLFNLSDEEVNILLPENLSGEFELLFTGEKLILPENKSIKLSAWEYKVFSK